MTFLSVGDTGGLTFRADDSLTMFYRLSLESQGMYTMYSCQVCPDQSATEETLLQYGKVKINTIGIPNNITIVVINTTKYLYINGNFVTKLDNTTNTNSDEIGLFGVSQNQSTNVSFSDVRVWKRTNSGQLR